MDSERRHELETNELREFLDNFKDFWDRHGNKILITLIVVLGGYAGYAQYHRWKSGVQEDAYAALLNATSADALRAVAGEHETVHDEAMRRAGDLDLGQARSLMIEDKADSAKALLASAAASYQALIDRGSTDLYKLNGYEGLAMAAVMRGEWDKAAKAYQSMHDLAGETYLAQAQRAQAGLDRLDQLKDPIAFADDSSFDFGFDDAPGGSAPQPAPVTDDGEALAPVQPVPPTSE